jgi:ankyrin repeat protein
VDVVKMLLVEGAKINSISVRGERSGNTSLYDPITLFMVIVCFVILFKDGYTSLHNAARYGHLEVATLLLNNGANIEASVSKVRKFGMG